MHLMFVYQLWSRNNGIQTKNKHQTWGGSENCQYDTIIPYIIMYMDLGLSLWFVWEMDTYMFKETYAADCRKSLWRIVVWIPCLCLSWTCTVNGYLFSCVSQTRQRVNSGKKLAAGDHPTKTTMGALWKTNMSPWTSPCLTIFDKQILKRMI